MKRSVLVGLLIVLLSCSAVFGAPNCENRYSIREWESVFDEFSLESVNEVPAGVTPLVVTSPGQLRKLLSQSRDGRICLTVDIANLEEMSLLTAGETLG